MRERTMNWYFEPRRDNGGTRQHEDDSAPGLISIPVDVLQRHGALVLDPGQAVAVRDDPTPRSTVYRARSLLVPDNLLQPVRITGYRARKRVQHLAKAKALGVCCWSYRFNSEIYDDVQSFRKAGRQSGYLGRKAVDMMILASKANV